jgi:thymidylate synthase
MKILALISGEYGNRHVENISKHGPETWQINTWRTPPVFPPFIDDPEDFLPDKFDPADLILSFAEHKGAAELLPDIARMTGAKAVLVAVDDEAWLPRGLDRQLHGWLADLDVACATPKPLCSLTESTYGVTRHEQADYQSPEISEFARFFGMPELELEINPERGIITGAHVKRDAVCGCARFVAEGLVGLSVNDAEEKAGLLHHHYPCLASMVKLPHFDHDTLMHVSGQVLKNNVGEQVKPYKKVRSFKPGKYSE